MPRDGEDSGGDPGRDGADVLGNEGFDRPGDGSPIRTGLASQFDQGVDPAAQAIAMLWIRMHNPGKPQPDHTCGKHTQRHER